MIKDIAQKVIDLQPILKNEHHRLIRIMSPDELQNEFPRYITLINTVAEKANVGPLEIGHFPVTEKINYCLISLEAAETEQDFVETSERLLYTFSELILLIIRETEGSEASKKYWSDFKKEFEPVYWESILPAIQKMAKV